MMQIVATLYKHRLHCINVNYIAEPKCGWSSGMGDWSATNNTPMASKAFRQGYQKAQKPQFENCMRQVTDLHRNGIF
jgi:hypothetical protein